MAQGTVLLVEEDKSARELMSQILKQQGYDVVEAESPEKGMEAMRPRKGQCTIDLVLCNRASLSQNDADPILQFLGQRPPVPVVLLANHPDLHHATQMFRQGVMDYLVKPVQANVLCEVVRRAVKLRGSDS